jgi:hypothetical protein
MVPPPCVRTLARVLRRDSTAPRRRGQPSLTQKETLRTTSEPPLTIVYSKNNTLSRENGAARWWCVVDGSRSFLVRGEWPASWEPQEEGMMSIAASFPSVKKPRFMSIRRKEPIWLKVMLASLRQLRIIYIWCLVQALLASCNAEPAHNTTKYFVPNLRWGCQSHRFTWNKGYECIEWKMIIVCE